MSRPSLEAQVQSISGRALFKRGTLHIITYQYCAGPIANSRSAYHWALWVSGGRSGKGILHHHVGKDGYKMERDYRPCHSRALRRIQVVAEGVAHASVVNAGRIIEKDYPYSTLSNNCQNWAIIRVLRLFRDHGLITAEQWAHAQREVPHSRLANWD